MKSVYEKLSAKSCYAQIAALRLGCMSSCDVSISLTSCDIGFSVRLNNQFLHTGDNIKRLGGKVKNEIACCLPDS